MNIIKINNIKKIVGTSRGLDIKTNETFIDKDRYILILNEEDINNENRIVKLKGYDFECFIIPNKFKYTFNETKLGKLILHQLSGVITYY